MQQELIEAASLLKRKNPKLAAKLLALVENYNNKPDLSTVDKSSLRHLKKRIRVAIERGQLAYRSLPLDAWIVAIEEREAELGVGKAGKPAKSLIGV